MNLLLDEMLSVRLPARLAGEKVFAAHVVHRSLQGKPDHEIWQYAHDNDFTVVTVNAGDYFRLASRSEIHGGVIVIRESGLDVAEQLDRIRAAIREIARCGESSLINHVLEVQGPRELRWVPVPPG